MIYFDIYRNCTGSYVAEMEQDIQSTMKVVDCLRDDGELYHQKFALQLGPMIAYHCSHQKKRPW